MAEADERSRHQDGTTAALEVISQYVESFAAGDARGVDALHSPGFPLDFVHLDAYEGRVLSAEQVKDLWVFLFNAFPEMDYRVTRTITAETVVVTERTFVGTHAGPLGPPVLPRPVEPTDRTIRFRGLSMYEVQAGLIQKEKSYLDSATFVVELWVEL